MIAFIFPGQGSQEVGMGRLLAEASVDARVVFDEADEAFAGAGVDGADSSAAPSLRDLCFHGPDEQLGLTEVTQPAILAASIAACRVLIREGIAPAYVAGHSLGEYSAHVAAGTMSLSSAVSVVRRRGRYMQEAVPVGEGAMAAILGLDPEVVGRVCDEASQGEVVSPANINCPGQVVIAGATAAVGRAMEYARAAGARRAIPLAVSAPFHCAMMRPAQARLEPILQMLPVHEPRVPIVANVDAATKRASADAIEALIRQVSAPVLWERVVRRLASEGVSTYVEVGPGSVLSGLVRKIDKNARILRFSSPADLDAVVTGCSTSTEKS